MSHFAELDENNTVLRVVVADSLEWCEERLGGRWVQTSYNTAGGAHKDGGAPLRKNYAAPGYTYDEARDAFVSPKPTDDAVLGVNSVWEIPDATLLRMIQK